MTIEERRITFAVRGTADDFLAAIEDFVSRGLARQAGGFAHRPTEARSDHRGAAAQLIPTSIPEAAIATLQLQQR